MFEIFKKLTNREKRLLIIAVILMVMYGTYALAFEPSRAKLDETKEQLNRLEQQEAQLNREIANYNQLKDSYQNYNLDELLTQLPKQGKVPEIILWLQQLFLDPQITHSGIGFSRGEDIEQYLQINLSVSGPYSNVQGIINRIEGNERLTTIETVNLSGGANSVSANLSIRIYGQDFTDISEEEYNFNNNDLFRIDF